MINNKEKCVKFEMVVPEHVKRKNISVGIIVYNEVSNIENLIRKVIEQQLKQCVIKEIVIVSSGSNDGTDEVILELVRQYNMIKFYKQKEREGKSSAINLFLKKSTFGTCFLINGDSLPGEDSFQILLSSLNSNKKLIGARPIPVNLNCNFIGFCVNLLWELNHEISLEKPKISEMIVFRKDAVDLLPEKSPVDEANLEAIVKGKGFETGYKSNAKILIRGPETLKEFVSQRRRIAYGHIWLYRNFGYLVSTNEIKKVVKILIKKLKVNFMDLIYTIGVVLVEVIARILGNWDYYVKEYNPHYIWHIAKSTKKRI